jgi:hypothetical protein
MNAKYKEYIIIGIGGFLGGLIALKFIRDI